MIYGYARCSTNDVKQNISRQVRELMSLGATHETIYKEFASGSKSDRIELNRLLSVVKQGDTIIATEVSRITRSTKDLCNIIDFAKEKKIRLDLGSFVLDCRENLDPFTESIIKFMGVFAELERNILSSRVKSGMENAKAQGKVIGRKTASEVDIPERFYRYYEQYLLQKINVTELARLCNVSRTTAYKYIRLIKNRKDS